MPTYARIENGHALDPVTADSAEAAASLFPSENWTFEVVPGGTKHGAKKNVDGTFTNPAAIALPNTLTKVSFMDHAYDCLGGDLSGISRYGDIIGQAKASANPLAIASLERYRHASVLERDDVANFLDILISDPTVDLTTDERNVIIDDWPAE